MADQQMTADIPPIPMLVGRVDEASLDEITMWARHPYVGMGVVARQVFERLIREIGVEREACARIADDARDDEEYGHAAFRCVQIAQAIRARGEEPSPPQHALDDDPAPPTAGA